MKSQLTREVCVGNLGFLTIYTFDQQLNYPILYSFPKIPYF